MRKTTLDTLNSANDSISMALCVKGMGAAWLSVPVSAISCQRGRPMGKSSLFFVLLTLGTVFFIGYMISCCVEKAMSAAVMNCF
jgi:hypothetical protein